MENDTPILGVIGKLKKRGGKRTPFVTLITGQSGCGSPAHGEWNSRRRAVSLRPKRRTRKERDMSEPEDYPYDVDPEPAGIPGFSMRTGARLCNFPTRSAELLPEHTTWLLSTVVPLLRDPQGAWIDVLAYASKRGDIKYNQGLSDRRRMAVVEFLKQKSGNPNLPFNRNHAFGEQDSDGGPLDNNGYWRAVGVYVYGGKMPAPEKIPPVETGSRDFKIRVVGSGGAGAAPPSVVIKTPLPIKLPIPVNFGGEVYFFELVDIKKKQKVHLAYGGAGASIGIPKLPGFGSVGTAADFTEFTLNRGSSLFSFAGPANIRTEAGASVPGNSIGGDIHLEFKSWSFFKRGIRVEDSKKKPADPRCVRMATGAGVGAQLAAGSSGKISLVPKKIFPYTGP